MKYTVEVALAAGGGRLGTLTQVVNGCNVAMETPMCTLFTRGGSCPNLSAVMLERIKHVPAVACMSLGHMSQHHENIQRFGKGVAEFTGLSNKIILATLHDASLPVPSGKNDKNGVAVWSKSGKVKLDVELFIKVNEALRPHWFAALSDGDTDKSHVRKRLTKAVDRTLDWLDEILERKEKSQILRNSSILGVVEGGYCVEERTRSAKETSARAVDGFVIEGFEKGHSGVDLFKDEEFVNVLSSTIALLPDNKPRFMEAVWSPWQVVQAFHLGVDVFSMAYPHKLTERGRALVADYSLPPLSQSARLEMEGHVTDGVRVWSDLYDKSNFAKFSPLLPGCTCYTCENFTCSYIHHLLNTQELLAYVLLTIHNFHQYIVLFERLRQTAREGRSGELEASLKLQEERSGPGVDEVTGKQEKKGHKRGNRKKEEADEKRVVEEEERTKEECIQEDATR